MFGGGKIKLTTKQKGDITELQCIVELRKLGLVISIPYGEDSPYDIIVDINNKLFKIQCKTARKKDDVLVFNCKSGHQNSTKTYRRNYIDKIDFFMTYYGNTAYMVPVSVCGTSQKLLRLGPTKNGQTKNVDFAEDFELIKIISEI